ncbi:MAG TPA: Gmad2 immunoglobulin-like domain-containing protein [Candidatus Doudnabacteria bacterium]|nr:Gmad2 immunoglobulin-like domain-containing protein [Candidatus Doudnabacteria bacterium]
MNNRNLIIAIIAAVLIAGGIYVWQQNRTSIASFEDCITAGYPVSESHPRQCTAKGKTFTEPVGSGTEEETISTDMIQVGYPTSGESVTSPFELRGLARGPWYFEATFSAELLDANGNQLAEIPVMAQGEWMTEEFVPFQAIINFPTPETATGTLILHKANASGLPEHDDKVEIPLNFD